MERIQQLQCDENNIDLLVKTFNQEFNQHVIKVLNEFDNTLADWESNVDKLLLQLIKQNKLYHIKFVLRYTNYSTDFKQEAEYAAKCGNYEICKFFHQKGYNNIDSILSGAIFSQNKQIIDYALSNNAKYKDEDKILDVIATNNCIPLDLHKEVSFNEILHYIALLGKENLINNILYYFNNNQQGVLKIVKCSLIISGNISAFKSIINVDRIIDKDICSLIAKYDREELFEYLNKNDRELLTIAIINGSLRCVRFLYKNEDVKQIAILASMNNRLNIVSWAIGNGANNFNEILTNSMKYYNKGIIKLLSRHYKIDYYRIITTSHIAKIIIYACKKYLEKDEKCKKLLQCIKTGKFNIALNDFTLEELNASIYLATRYDIIAYVKSLFILSQHMSTMFVILNYYQSTKIIKWLKNTFKLFS